MRNAFTLLEVLLATALLAIVVVATVGWTGAQVRAARRASARLIGDRSLEACVRAVEDDLLLAVTGPDGTRWRVDGTNLMLTTLNRMPGDPPGVHLVSWRFADAALKRAVADQPPRIATRRLAALRFVVADGALLISYRGVEDSADRTRRLRVAP